VRTHVVIVAAVLFALCAVAASAADISGKWIAQVPGRDGTPQEQVFVFKVAGAALTGTVSNPRGEQEISEGKVSGDDVSFVTIRKMQDMEMKTQYKGKVAGNEIKFTREMVMPAGGMGGGMGGPPKPVEFTAKRAS
jgi:hypothetical protein